LKLADQQLEDWIDNLRKGEEGIASLMQISSRVLAKSGAVQAEKLIPMWLRQLAAAAQGQPVTGFLVARDAVITMIPLEQQQAEATLSDVVRIWRDGMNRPLPTACKTALALIAANDPRQIYDGGFELAGEVQDLCLARMWPEFAALKAEPDFEDV